MLNRNKTGLALIFWTGLDQVRWKLVFRTDFEKLSLDYRRQIKPGQFYTAIHLTIWAVQNGPGMLNRNKSGLALIFWTGLDQGRWKLVFRTVFEKHSLDYRRQLKPGQFCTTLPQWVNSVLLYVRSEVFHDVSLMYDKCSSGICLMYDTCSSGICLMYESLRT